MNINDLRAKYPGYADEEIIGALKATKYRDYSEQEIGDAIGYKPKPAGFWRGVGDLGVEAVSGVARGVKFTADAFGANNAVSRGAGAVDEFAREYLSASAKADDKRIAEIMAAAEDAGIWEQVKAAAQAVAVSPGRLAMNALGTSVPTIAATMIPGVGQAGAAARLGMLGSMGAVQGAGTVKGSIYQRVRDEQIKAGASEAEAEAAAAKAQEYGGENTANIVGGSLLGGAASATGLQPVAARLLQRGEQAAAAGQRGMLDRALNPEGLAARTLMGGVKEAPLEAAQGGQEQYAGNVALQREGFDTPTFRGVAGQSTMEGLAAFGPGAAFGALDKKSARGEDKKPDVSDVLKADSVEEAAATAMAAIGAVPALPAPITRLTRLSDAASITDTILDESGNIVDPGIARRGMLLSAPSQQGPLALPAPSGQPVYMADQNGNVAPQPSEARTEALGRNFDAQQAAEAENARRAVLGKQTPRGEAPAEPIPVGEAQRLDYIPTGEATDWEYIPTGRATEIDAETILADDSIIKAKDGDPFVSKTGAAARAFGTGGQIITLPNHFGDGKPGYVVRPLVTGQPNNTQGTNAGDLAGTAGRGTDDAGRGDGTGSVPDNRPADVLERTASPAGQGVAGAGAAGDGAAGQGALNEGDPVNIVNAKGEVRQSGVLVGFGNVGVNVRLAGGEVITVIKNRVKKAETSRPAEATGATDGQGQEGRQGLQVSPNQGAGDNPASGARELRAGPTGNPMLDNPASWVIREKATGKVVMETFDKAKVNALNTEKYEAVPVAKYLGDLNKSTKEDAQPTPTPAKTEAPAPAAATATPAAAAGTAGGAVEADGLKATEGDFIRPASNAERMMGAKRRDAIAGNLGGVYRPNGSRGAGFYKQAANAEAPVQAASGASPAAPAAPAPAEPDPFAELFGTPAEQAAAQERALAAIAAKKADVERIRSAIAGEKKRAIAEHDDWAGRVYKRNKNQIDLPGDGPSSRESMSVSAINEGRRRRAMEALTQEIKALDKLTDALSTDSGAERVLSNLREMYTKAQKAVESGNWPGMDQDAMFQSMLLDDLKFRGPGGKGNVTSNGLSKAVLAAIKEKAGGQEKAQGQDQQETGDQTAGAVGGGRGNVAPTPLKDRVDAKREKAPEAAAPAPTPAAEPTPPAEPKTKRAPKSFRKKVMVSTDVFVEDSGKFEAREVDADTALKALDADISELQAFKRCIGG